MQKITIKMLEKQVNNLNKSVGHKNASYSEIGSYVLDYAYGGISLHKYVNANGAISDVLGCGHITKRDLFNRIYAFIAGINA